MNKDLKEVSGHMGAPRYREQILTDLKREIGSNAIIVGTLIPHFHQWIGHADRKSIRKIGIKMTH